MAALAADILAKHRRLDPEPYEFVQAMSDAAAARLVDELTDSNNHREIVDISIQADLQTPRDFVDKMLNLMRVYRRGTLALVYDRLIDMHRIDMIRVDRASEAIIQRLRSIAADPAAKWDRGTAVAALVSWPGLADDLYEQYLADVERALPSPDDNPLRDARELEFLKFHHAGWEPDGRGGRRLLRVLPGVQLVADGEGEPVYRPNSELDTPCPTCGRLLTTLFALDTTDGDLVWLALPAGRLRMPFCRYCAFDGSFLRLDLDGSVSHDGLPTRGAADLNAVLPDHPLYAKPFDPEAWPDDDAPMLGGAPLWRQDPDWPHCPCCRRLMRHVGQFPHGGYLFAFLCPECLVATWHSSFD